MLSCWHPSGWLRPTFGQLVESVSGVVSAMQRHVDVSRQSPRRHYVNAVVDGPSITDHELDGLAETPVTCRSTTV